jgi:hypothetical protein
MCGFQIVVHAPGALAVLSAATYRPAGSRQMNADLSHGSPRALPGAARALAGPWPYIQQRQLSRDQDVDQITTGMTRSQVRYLPHADDLGSVHRAADPSTPQA